MYINCRKCGNLVNQQSSTCSNCGEPTFISLMEHMLNESRIDLHEKTQNNDKLSNQTKFNITQGTLIKYNGVDDSHIVIPNTVSTIGEFAFYNCTNIESITIPNSVKQIQNNAFNGCVKLKKLTIPDSVTAIDYMAFNRCIELEEVIIPNSVSALDDTIFMSCKNLKTVWLPFAFKNKRNEIMAWSGASNYKISIDIPLL